MPDFEGRNSADVMIFGQNYTISGNISRDAIIKIADYVSGKMMEIGEDSNLPTSRVAILSAMSIAEELFAEQQRHRDNERYAAMWEEAKTGFAKAREELNNATEQKNELIRQNGEKDQQLAVLYNELAEIKKHNEVLRARVEELSLEITNKEDLPELAQKKVAELELKCRDLESSFFDIQMENIRLKTENENLRRQRL